MKSTFKKLSGSKIELEVLLTKDEFRPYWDAAHEHALANVHLKGFRPGTAPKELAEKAIDADKVFEEAARNAVRFSLDEAVKDNEWTLIDAPKIEILESPDLNFKYKANLTIFPEIKLGNYKKIAKKVLADKKEIKVEPAEIEKSLEWIRDSRAKIVRVEREARKGDVVDIDLESSVDSFKGEKFILGQGRFVPGLEAKLENHKAGENLEFSLDVRDQNTAFKVKINGVYERHLPELNDNFAQGLGPNFKTVDDLKKNIREGIAFEKEKKERERLHIKMLDEIIKDSRMDIPETMIEKTLDKMVMDYERMMEAAGKPGSRNSIVKNGSHERAIEFSLPGKKEEEIRDQLREQAKNNVASNLVLYKIAEAEHLQPAKNEVEEEAKVQNLDAEKFYDYIYGIVLNRKVFQFLSRDANIQMRTNDTNNTN